MQGGRRLDAKGDTEKPIVEMKYLEAININRDKIIKERPNEGSF